MQAKSKIFFFFRLEMRGSSEMKFTINLFYFSINS